MTQLDISLTHCATGIAQLKPRYQTLALVLGDQLNVSHSWFRQVDSQRLLVLMEVRQETDYVRHHQQKILAFFGAMRAFAAALAKAGHQVLYISLDSPDNKQAT